MKIWALKWTPMEEDSAEVGMEGISLHQTRESAIQAFENDGLVEDHPLRPQMVDQLLQDGIVDIDNQTTVTLSEVEVND